MPLHKMPTEFLQGETLQQIWHNLLLNVPSNLTCVDTLPCDIWHLLTNVAIGPFLHHLVYANVVEWSVNYSNNVMLITIITTITTETEMLMFNCVQPTFIHSTKQPDGTVQNDAIDVQQTVLYVNRHLNNTQTASTSFTSLSVHSATRLWQASWL